MNILIMMAGNSDEFSKSGLNYPKLLTEVNNSTMIELVINSLSEVVTEANNVVFIIKKDDDEKYFLGDVIKLLVPYARIVLVERETAGAATTALMAIECIDKNLPILLFNA